jgi:hypothetical protein|tara:strand:+ start:87 stop:200 length:114 start_codon:yes stop_codon:yes gene_type:complete
MKDRIGMINSISEFKSIDRELGHKESYELDDDTDEVE